MSQTLVGPAPESSRSHQPRCTPQPASQADRARCVDRRRDRRRWSAVVVARGSRAFGASGISFRARFSGRPAAAQSLVIATSHRSPRTRTAPTIGSREGDQSLLWAKWEDRCRPPLVSVRSRRYRSGARLRGPRRVFVSRAIDYPLVETGGGEIWQRIPPESPVVGHTLLVSSAFTPSLVLGKVQIVNDIVDEHPFLVVVNPFARPDVAFSIFDAHAEWPPMTMAATGYFHDGKPSFSIAEPRAFGSKMTTA